MLRAQIDNDRDSVGGSGILEVTFRPLSFVEHRTFAKRSHVKHRKVFDMTYIGSTRVVDQASAHSLPLTVSPGYGKCPPDFCPSLIITLLRTVHILGAQTASLRPLL